MHIIIHMYTPNTCTCTCIVQWCISTCSPYINGEQANAFKASKVSPADSFVAVSHLSTGMTERERGGGWRKREGGRERGRDRKGGRRGRERRKREGERGRKREGGNRHQNTMEYFNVQTHNLLAYLFSGLQWVRAIHKIRKYYRWTTVESLYYGQHWDYRLHCTLI